MPKLPEPTNGFYYTLDELDTVSETLRERADEIAWSVGLAHSLWRAMRAQAAGSSGGATDEAGERGP